jgi:hypothetical protein
MDATPPVSETPPIAEEHRAVGSSFESSLRSSYFDPWVRWIFIAAVSLSYVVLALRYFSDEEH